MNATLSRKPYASCSVRETSTLCEAAVGRLGNETLPHELLAVGMSHSMALVPLNHPDGQVRMGLPFEIPVMCFISKNASPKTQDAQLCHMMHVDARLSGGLATTRQLKEKHRLKAYTNSETYFTGL